MDLHLLEQPRNARPAVVGDQRHPVPAHQQFLGERVRRDHVPPGPARGEDVVAGDDAHLIPLLVTTKRFCCRCGFLRLNASSSPKPIASAIIEEPP